MALFSRARKTSIVLSATAFPFEVAAERVTASVPDWKVATSARMPTLRTIIAIISSIRPKPASSRARSCTTFVSAGGRSLSRPHRGLPIGHPVASFAYSAINAQGVELNGEISAADLTAAREQLRVKGLLAQTLKEVAEGPGIGQTSIGAK